MDNDSANPLARRRLLVSAAGLLLLATIPFLDVLLWHRDRLPGDVICDLNTQFVHWRRFGAEQLASGNLALWNPHVFCGVPFFGSFESAQLYPPNLLYVVLPLRIAIDITLILNLWLSGLFMYIWAARHRLSSMAAFLAAAIFMLATPQFLHVRAGHLSSLSTMPWAVLIFIAVDDLLDRPKLRGVLIGTLAVGLQILAGHPQYVFYTSIAVWCYLAFALPRAPHRAGTLATIILVFAGGAMLAAVQLLTGLDVTEQSVRSGGLPFEAAAAFSLWPGQLLSAVAPGFFGGYLGMSYWGRGYLWEMTFFASLTGLWLAVVAVVQRRDSMCVRLAILAGVCLVLAWGAYTPLFSLLYACVPGFDQLRGMSKFMFPALIFISLLAGMGLDTLLHQPQRQRFARYSLIATSVVSLLAAVCVWTGRGLPPAAWWTGLVRWVATGPDRYLPLNAFDDAEFLSRTATVAAVSLLVAAITAAVLWCVYEFVRTPRRRIVLMAALAILELLTFDIVTRESFPLSAIRSPQIEAMIAEQPSQYRVFCLPPLNDAMTSGYDAIWGYQPLVLKRYAEFIASTQGKRPDEASVYVPFHTLPPIYLMLRCGMGILPTREGLQQVVLSNPLHRLLLINHCRIIPERDAMLDALTSPTFDPRTEVLLETAPGITLTDDPVKGQARIVDEDTDHLTIEADVSTPAILLITDAYARGWRAEALPGSDQTHYTLQPANYVLRAVPLQAGHHRFRVVYRPRAFVIGAWLSAVAVIVWILLLVVAIRQARRTPAESKPGSLRRFQ